MQRAASRPFVCRGFVVHHDRCGLKVGTDTIYFAAYAAQSHWFGSGQPRSALDIGSGTGLLSLILAHRLPSLTNGGDCRQLELVHGVELDDDAYEQTAGNYDLSPWRGKMQAFHTSFQDYARTFTQPEGGPTDQQDATNTTTSLASVGYDLVICNPPYHPRPPKHPQADHSSRARARFSDYLSPTDLLSGVAQTLRKERGQFWLFYPYLLADRFVSDAAQHNLRLRHRCDICFRRGKHLQRSILMFEKSAADTSAALDRVQVTLREESNAFTKEFVDATRDIYADGNGEACAH